MIITLAGREGEFQLVTGRVLNLSLGRVVHAITRNENRHLIFPVPLPPNPDIVAPVKKPTATPAILTKRYSTFQLVTAFYRFFFAFSNEPLLHPKPRSQLTSIVRYTTSRVTLMYVCLGMISGMELLKTTERG